MVTISIENGIVVKTTSFDTGIVESIYYRCLEHPNIVKVKDILFSTKNENRLKITMEEYVPLSTISPSMVELEQILKDLSDALAYLEANSILQSDVKKSNIFFDLITKKYVLADFDVALYGVENFSQRVATWETIPPEVSDTLYDVTPDLRSDVFSLGIVIASFLFQNYLLWESPKYTKNLYALKSWQREILTSNFRYKDLLAEMIDADPKKRPTALELASSLGVLKIYSSVRQIPFDSLTSIEKKVFEHFFNDYPKCYWNIDRTIRPRQSMDIFSSVVGIGNIQGERMITYAFASIMLASFLSTLPQSPSRPFEEDFEKYQLMWDEDGSDLNVYRYFNINGRERMDLITPENIQKAMLTTCLLTNFKLLF